MRAGKLDRRITIQRKTVTPSTSGEPIEQWSELVCVWASMTPVRGEERYSTPQLVAIEELEFRVRYSGALRNLSALDRVIYPEIESGEPQHQRIHDILAVHEIGRREGLQIITRRRAAVLDVEEVAIVFDFSMSADSGYLVLLEDI